MLGDGSAHLSAPFAEVRHNYQVSALSTVDVRLCAYHSIYALYIFSPHFTTNWPTRKGLTFVDFEDGANTSLIDYLPSTTAVVVYYTFIVSIIVRAYNRASFRCFRTTVQRPLYQVPHNVYIHVYIQL